MGINDLAFEAGIKEDDAQVPETVVEALEYSDYEEYKKGTLELESDGYALMYNVPNNEVHGYTDAFVNSRRFRNIKLVSVFNEPTPIPTPIQNNHKIDRRLTAIWYKY